MAENILYNEGRRSEKDLNKDKDSSNTGKMDDNTGTMAEAKQEQTMKTNQQKQTPVKTA